MVLICGIIMVSSFTACSQKPSESEDGSRDINNSSDINDGGTENSIRTIKILGSDIADNWETRDKQPAFEELNKMLEANNLALDY